MSKAALQAGRMVAVHSRANLNTPQEPVLAIHDTHDSCSEKAIARRGVTRRRYEMM